MKLWIARDFGGGLHLFPEKPIKLVEYSCWDGEDWYKIDQDLFPEVTFENSPMDAEFEFTANRYQDDEHEVSIDNIYTSTMLNKIYVDLIC